MIHIKVISSCAFVSDHTTVVERIGNNRKFEKFIKYILNTEKKFVSYVISLIFLKFSLTFFPDVLV
jgi:hypothetical protein